MTRRGFTLIELMIVIAIIAIIAAIAIPGLLAAQRASNERNASASLRTLSSSETDFRSNDRDGDRAQNFWVYDIYSLFAMVPSTTGTSPGTSTDPNAMIKLVEPSIAAADGSGKALITSGILGTTQSIGSFTPKASYSYKPFSQYVTGATTAAYGSTTAGNISAYNTSACYNYSKFAFLAAPVSYSGGRKIFIVNEDNTIWASDPGGTYDALYSGGTAGGTITFDSAVVGGTTISCGTSTTFSYPAAPGAVGWSKLD
jgi:prepilin-type N-terminal cleavage/methylation domain-containing protein